MKKMALSLLLLNSFAFAGNSDIGSSVYESPSNSTSRSCDFSSEAAGERLKGLNIKSFSLNQTVPMQLRSIHQNEIEVFECFVKIPVEHSIYNYVLVSAGGGRDTAESVLLHRKAALKKDGMDVYDVSYRVGVILDNYRMLIKSRLFRTHFMMPGYVLTKERPISMSGVPAFYRTGSNEIMYSWDQALDHDENIIGDASFEPTDEELNDLEFKGLIVRERTNR